MVTKGGPYLIWPIMRFSDDDKQCHHEWMTLNVVKVNYWHTGTFTTKWSLPFGKKYMFWKWKWYNNMWFGWRYYILLQTNARFIVIHAYITCYVHISIHLDYLQNIYVCIQEFFDLWICTYIWHFLQYLSSLIYYICHTHIPNFKK